MELSGELVRLRRTAILSVALLFVIGVGLVATSLLGSTEAVDWYTVAYDFGLGALIATGVATVITMLLSRLEAREAAYIAERRKREAARLDEQREQADRARRESEAHWTNIEKELDQLGRDMGQTALEWKVDEESRKIQYLIVDTIEPILTQLYELRANVDPKFEHPNKPFVEAIMQGLRSQVEAERMASEKAGTSGSVSSVEEPPD